VAYSPLSIKQLDKNPKMLLTLMNNTQKEIVRIVIKMSKYFTEGSGDKLRVVSGWKEDDDLIGGDT